MAAGLTRSEQIALVAVGLLVVAGVAYQHWSEADRASSLAAPDLHWREIASVRANRDSTANYIQRQFEEQLSQLAVKSADAGTTQGQSAAAGEPMDLNAATLDELDTLPGIGPVRARDIMVTREMRGGFGSVEDLLDVPGIGEVTMEGLRPLVRVVDRTTTTTLAGTMRGNVEALAEKLRSNRPDTSPAPPAQSRINLNTATPEELEKIPGVGPALAGRIIQARAIRPFTRPEDLIEVKGIGPKTFEKMKPWVTVE